MLRVKVPQGILDAPQLHALADVAETFSRGFGHVTTRQNVQFHFIPRAEVEPAMRRLAEAGLTSREACGSAVRNITGCPYAGVSADEVFDVTPYGEALTRYLLRHPLSASLPRKFKIAFEGCASEDHALIAINDIGFRARVREANGRTRRGFRVTIGGGTSTVCTSGAELFEFLPAGEIFELAEAVLRVFHRLGDFKHKQRNRMKFLIKELGWERWREEFQAAFASFRAEGGAPLPFDPDHPPVESAPDWPRPIPPTVADVTSCPGAESCRLAVTQSRGLGRLLGDTLRARPDLVAAAPDLTIKISGCPNGCGQHHVAGIGLQGSVRKVGGKALPQYFVMVGGGVDAEGAHFARLAAKVPARRMDTAIARLISLYQSDCLPGESATAFFRRVELSRVKAELADLEQIAPEAVVPTDFVDLGDEAAFEVTTMDGE